MFTTALAEATTTTTSSSFSFQLDFSTIITIVLVAYFLIIGIASLATGKVYGWKGITKYTDESVAKFARPYGLCEILAGIGLGMVDSYLTLGIKIMPVIIAGAVVLVIAVIGIAVATKKILVKKEGN